MSDSTTNDNASVEQTPQQEIAEIEKAQASAAEEANDQTDDQKPSAFDQLAEKKGFNSVDDLVSAYENLESKMAPQSKELKDLRSMVEEIKKSTVKPEKSPFDDLPEEQREAMDLLGKLLDQRLEQRLSPLLKKAEVEEASSKISGVRKQYPDVTDGEFESAFSMMEKFPKMELGEAIKIASYDRVYKGMTSTNKKTVINQQNKRAFAEGASGAKSNDNVDYSKMSLEELEKIIPRD